MAKTTDTDDNYFSLQNRREEKRSRVAVVALGVITLAAIGTAIFAFGASRVLIPTESERAARAHNESIDGPFRLHAKVIDGDNGSMSYINLPGSAANRSQNNKATTREEWRQHPNDNRPVVILLHGIKTDSCLYPPLITRHWANTSGVVFLCPDLLGHGLSPWPSCPLTIERHIAALDNLLERHFSHSRQVHVIGMSLGALIGLELSAHLVRCGRAPVTMSLLATPYFQSREQAIAAAREHSGWFRHRKCSQFLCRYVLCRQSWFWRHALKSYFRKQYPDAPYDVLNGALTHSASGIVSCVDDVVIAHRPMAAARIVALAKLPTLLIDGGADRLCNSQVRSALHRALSIASPVSLLLPDASHDFVMSQPKETWRAIQNFVGIAHQLAQ